MGPRWDPRPGTARHGSVQHGTARHGTARHESAVEQSVGDAAWSRQYVVESLGGGGSGGGGGAQTTGRRWAGRRQRVTPRGEVGLRVDAGPLEGAEQAGLTEMEDKHVRHGNYGTTVIGNEHDLRLVWYVNS